MWLFGEGGGAGKEGVIIKKYEKIFEGVRCKGLLFWFELFYGYMNRLKILNILKMFSLLYVNIF